MTNSILRSSGRKASFSCAIGADRSGWGRDLMAVIAWIVVASLAVCLAGCGPLGLDGPGTSLADSPNTISEVTTPADNDVAVVVNGEEITIGELHAHMQKQFLEDLLRQPEIELFALREQAVRELVQRRAVEEAAAEAGTTPEALFDQVTADAKPATLEDVTRWYNENQARLRGARLEDVGTQIQGMLDNEARGRAWGDFIGPRVDAIAWKMVIQPPRQDLTATRLVRGKSDAKVTIMAFSDYQCPYCIRSEPILAEVLGRYPEDVRLIHRHFPLDSIHPYARPAAEATMCADEQGKFWEFHDAIFARGGRLTDESFAEIGAELELDGESLAACIGDRRHQAFVQNDFEEGQAAGVTGTPAFFVNGIAIKGARDADELSKIVEAELDRIRAN